MNRSHLFRKLFGRAMEAVCLLAALVAVVPLFAFLWHLVAKGASSLSLSLITQLPMPPGELGGGLLNSILGSLLVVGLATVAGIPIGIGAAIFMTEFASPSVTSSLRFACDVLSGIPSIVMGLLAIMLTALTVAREWENGSMELLLSTPVRPWEIILGKLAPYLALGLVGAVFIYLAARLGFGVPFRGSHLLYVLLCLLFLTASLAQGLLISVATRQQQLAMQLSIITGLLPSLLLSGFVFPVESMPIFFQYFTSILSQKWFMMISRGVFLQGSGALDLARPILGLSVITGVLLTMAAKRFKKDLEP